MRERKEPAENLEFRVGHFAVNLKRKNSHTKTKCHENPNPPPWAFFLTMCHVWGFFVPGGGGGGALSTSGGGGGKRVRSGSNRLCLGPAMGTEAAQAVGSFEGFVGRAGGAPAPGVNRLQVCPVQTKFSHFVCVWGGGLHKAMGRAESRVSLGAGPSATPIGRSPP